MSFADSVQMALYCGSPRKKEAGDREEEVNARWDAIECTLAGRNHLDVEDHEPTARMYSRGPLTRLYYDAVNILYGAERMSYHC